jgi:tetratricopeptide (TPR) repeat protein
LYYYMLGLLGIKPIADMAPLAKAAAAKALTIDPTNSETDSALAAMAAAFDYDWKAAENHLRRATAAGASARTNYLYALYYLLPLGRVPEAMERSRLALESDPLSMLLHFGMAWCMYCARRYPESIECAQRSFEIDPNYYMNWLTMGLAQLGARKREEAIASIQRVTELAPWWSAGWGYLAAACYLANDRERSQQLARKLADSHNHTLGAASYYAAAGEKDAMFESLDGAFQQRDVFLVFIQSLPFFDPYRADPRFKSLLAKMNLA